MPTDNEKTVAVRPVVPLIPAQPRVRAGIQGTSTAVNAAGTGIPASTEKLEAEQQKKPSVVPKARGKYRFAKVWGVAETLTFKDGTSFTFPLIRRNNAPGYSPTSSIETNDEVLAKNLREAAKTNTSIREVVPAKV